MTGGWAPVLGAVVVAYGIAGLGAVLRRTRLLGPEADRPLVDLTVWVLMPALILETLAGNPRFTARPAVLATPLVAVATVLIGFAAAALFVAAARPLPGLHTPARRRTFVLATGMYNYGYVAIPLAGLLFDDDTLGALFVYNVGVEIAMWTAGVLVLTGGLGPGWWRRALNPPSVAVCAALAMNAAGVGGLLPPLVRTMLEMLGQCAIPLSLILVGAATADHLHPHIARAGRRATLAACVLRLGVLPAAFVAAAVWLPVPLEVRRVLVLQSAMPAAMFPIVLAGHYGGHTPTAVRIVLATSLLSLATTPLWLSVGLAALGAR